MRQLVHPAIEDVTVQAVLHALSDPVRVAIFVSILAQECTQSCSSFTKSARYAIPKSTLSQHFRILREAGLIRGERRGIEMHNFSRCSEIDQRFPGLLASIVQAYELQQKPRGGRKAKAKAS